MTLPPNLQMVPRDVTEAVRFWPSVIPVGTVEPPASAKVWLDTSTEPAVMKAWDGAAWSAIGGGGGGVPTSRTLTAGTGLTGGGDLSANRSFAVDLEYLQDQVASLIVAGTNVTKTYDDTAGTLTLAAAAGGGGAFLPIVPKVGGYLSAPNISNFVANSNQVRTSGNAGALPIMVAKQVTIDALSCYVDTAQASTNIRMGLYSADSDGHPVTKVAEVSVSGAATGQVAGTITPVVLPAGLYWAIAYVSSTTTLRLRGVYYTSAGMAGPSTGSLMPGMNYFPTANFGSSAALTTPITAWSFDVPDQVGLVAVRRSA